MDANEWNGARFRACAGDAQAFGATPVDAVRSLMAALPGDLETPIVIWPYNRGDAFFTDAQQAPLVELRGRGDLRTDSERAEWESLLASSFDATAARCVAAFPRTFWAR